MLGTLPYIIALDRSTRAAVVAVRGTWSIADFITDIVALPQRADAWLPPSLCQACPAQVQCPHLLHAQLPMLGLVHGSSACFSAQTLSTRSPSACALPCEGCRCCRGTPACCA